MLWINKVKRLAEKCVELKNKKIGVLFFLIFAILLVQFFALHTISREQQILQYYEQGTRDIIKYSADFYKFIGNAKSIVSILSTNTDIITALERNENDLIAEKRLLAKLDEYKKFNLDIKNIYIYDSRKNILYSDTRVYKGEQIELAGDFAPPDNKNKITVYVYKAYDGRDMLGVNLRVDRKSDNFIMVTFGSDTVGELFSKLANEKTDSFAVIYKTGEVLYKIGNENLVKRAIENRTTHTVNTYKYKNEKYLVIEDTSGNKDFSICLLRPVSKLDLYEVRTGIIMLTNISIIIVFVFLFIIIGIIRDVISMNKKMRRMSFINMKNEEIYNKRDIINLLYKATDDDIEKAKAYFMNNTSQGKNDGNIRLIRIKIMDFGTFCKANSYQDIKLYEYGIMNIVSEIIRKYFSGDVLYFKVGVIDALIFTDGECGESIEGIYSEATEVIKGYIGLEVCVCITSEGTLETIPELFSQLVDIAEYTFFCDKSALLDYSVMSGAAALEGETTEQAVSKVCENIISKNTDSEAFGELLDLCRKTTVSEAKRILWHVMLELNRKLEIIKTKNGLNVDFEIEKYFQTMQGMSNIYECFGLFKEIAEKLETESAAAEGVYSPNIARALNIINRSYSDENLCSNQIGEELGLSAGYLSRIFKKEMGITLSGMINEVRLREAVVKIVSTDETIKDIMESVGIYNQSYFVVLFKKKYGMSPSEYRSKYR